jgi:hypothetical protein
VKDGEGVSQAIVDVDGNSAIGLMWVALRPQRHVGGLGYWVVPPERGQGEATAAVRLVTPWALDTLDLRRLKRGLTQTTCLRSAFSVTPGSSMRDAFETSSLSRTRHGTHWSSR